MLAFVYGREYINDIDVPRDGPSPLDLSLRFAQLAVTLKPSSVRAHLALHESLYLRGDLTPAFAAGEAALSLNPLDQEAIGLIGSTLTLAGQIDRGSTMLKDSALRLTVNPAWLDFCLFVAAYVKGDLAAASRFAHSDFSENYPFGLLARALAAAAEGNRELAKQTGNRMLALYPNWNAPRQQMEKLIRSPELVNRLDRDLTAIMQP